MKRILWCCVALLLLSGMAHAGLVVCEYVPGEKVTLDTETGKHWYWKVGDFNDMTYDEQLSAIAGLGSYGNIASGWRMATDADMEELRLYNGWDLLDSFAANWRVTVTAVGFEGRYDSAVPESTDMHRVFSVSYSTLGSVAKCVWPFPDSYTLRPGPDEGFPVGAFVVSEALVIPAPAALGLAAVGLLACLPGVRRLSGRRTRPGR